MNFNTWFSSLQTRTARNSGAGLVAFRELLARLNNPQQNYKIIHVAGTNGKGTVCTRLAQALSRAGEKTGLFISPHLISPTERIQIDGQEITAADFIHAVEQVFLLAQEPLNFFEVLTAAALYYFAQNKVRYVVLETGLGGRKDPTNVCVPVLSVITSIGLDHTPLLGNTLEQIAFEKAGIIKPHIPVLCGALPVQAARVVEEIAQEKNAPLEIMPPLNAGNAHLQNMRLAQRAATCLGFSAQTCAEAIKQAALPGRFEVFYRGNKTFILDGAHNPPALANLLAYWQNSPFAQARAAVLCGFMQDKDYPQMMSMLAAYFKTGIVTAVSSVRAAGEEKISPLLPATWPFVPDVSAALLLAQERADVVLVTGSFYLVGAIRKQLIEA